MNKYITKKVFQTYLKKGDKIFLKDSSIFEVGRIEKVYFENIPVKWKIYSNSETRPLTTDCPFIEFNSIGQLVDVLIDW